MPPRTRSASLGTSDALIAKTQSGAIAKTVRVKTTSKANDLWLHAMIVTPSASRTLTASMIGDQDMTEMRTHFVKPNTTVAMTFLDGCGLREIHRFGDRNTANHILCDADRVPAMITRPTSA